MAAVWLVGVLAVRPDALAQPGSESAVSVRRFALVVGANDGGTGRSVLRYASADATRMSSVMHDIGGLAPSDQLRLLDPDAAELETGFARLSGWARSAQAAGHKVQFIFYYSGHSDEQGLLLGGERVAYRRLRALVDAIPADVRIAILDSCASGAFTRLKGGTKRAPFLVGSAADVKGHAFLTSSSEDEAAQESDRIGGSFFTHYLTTGLRGAADADGDKLVTLSEAYQFAFDETLARTETTRGGAQHAAYDIQLNGSGDLVMTDLRRMSARLAVGTDVGGRIFVRATDGRLAAELYKAPDSAPVALALEPGRYQVTVDDGQQLWRQDVAVAEAGVQELRRASLTEVPREQTVERGPEVEAKTQTSPEPVAPAPTTSEYRRVPFNVGLVPGASINSRTKGQKIRNHGSIAFLWSTTDRLDGIAVGVGATLVREETNGFQAAVGANVAHRLRGMQAAAFYNQATYANGAQAGLVNRANLVEGGAQFGLVNTGRHVRGVQFGLVNYAESADASIGLVAVTKEGGIHPEFFTSDLAAFNIGVRLPARYTYSFLSASIHPFGDAKGWMFGAGFGGHIPAGEKAFVDLDVSGQAYFRGLEFGRGIAPVGTFRVTFGWQALERLALFGGPTASAIFDDPADELPRPGYGWTAYTHQQGSFRVRVWPGFAAGLRF